MQLADRAVQDYSIQDKIHVPLKALFWQITRTLKHSPFPTVGWRLQRFRAQCCLVSNKCAYSTARTQFRYPRSAIPNASVFVISHKAITFTRVLFYWLQFSRTVVFGERCRKKGVRRNELSASVVRIQPPPPRDFLGHPHEFVPLTMENHQPSTSDISDVGDKQKTAELDKVDGKKHSTGLIASLRRYPKAVFFMLSNEFCEAITQLFFPNCNN